jgi:cytochrome P450
MSLPRLGYDPREGRDAKSSPAIEWVPALGCWCAFDTGAITAVLKSANFVAPNFAEWHHALSSMGIDCSSVIEILDYLAIANEGARHAEIRKNLAKTIAAHSAETKQLAASKLDELVPSLCREGSRVDLVRDIIRPVCDRLFETMIGVPVPSDDGISSSQLFDLYLSLSRRKKVVSLAGEMLQTYAEESDRLNTSPGYATSLRMLGFDSIAGSLGCSLLHELKQAAGQRLSDIAFPRTLPKTGVPYIERFAAADYTLGDAAIKQGDRIRLYLDPGAQQDHANNGECYFGRGRHSCLGEDMSTWLWRATTEALGRLPLRFSIESETRRKPDWVFNYYSSIVVSFHA